MNKYLGVILAFFLSVQNVCAADITPLGKAPIPSSPPQEPIDPTALVTPLDARAIISQSQLQLIQPNLDLNTLNSIIKFIISETYTLHLAYTNILKNPLKDEDRDAIRAKSYEYYDLYLKYFNMLYKGGSFAYVNEDANFIILRSNNVDYRFKKSAVSNLEELKTPSITQALQYSVQKNIVGVRAKVICHPETPNNSCIKFPQTVNGKSVIDMVGRITIDYDPNDLQAAAASMYLEAQKAALQVEAPSKYPYQTWFQGQIATFTQVGDLINIELTNPTALQKGSKIITAATLRFKMPTSALTTQLYIPNPDPSKSRIESTLGELISTAGSSLMGRSMKVLCQSSQGCAYDKNSGIISGTLYYSDISGDDIRKTIVDKRNAEGLKFTSITGKLLNAAGGYIRFNDESGALIATKKTSITNLASLQRYEKVVNFALTNPTQYQLSMTLTCTPNNVCSKNEVKDSSGKVVGIEIVGPTTVAMNPQDVRKIQAAIAAPQQAQVVTDEAKRVADINAAPKAFYRTFLEFKEALYKARGNPQAIEGIFKQVLEDLNQGRMRGFSGQNGMFDLAGMGLTSLPRTLPEVFSKSSAFVLNLSENNLSTIQGLERIPSGKLRGIHLYNNRNLTSLAPLAPHPLEFLIAFNTSVSRDEAGLVALSRGPSSQTLKELSLDNTELKSITILMNFQKLSKLSVRNNPVILKQNQVIANALTTLQNRGVQLFVK